MNEYRVLGSREPKSNTTDGKNLGSRKSTASLLPGDRILIEEAYNFVNSGGQLSYSKYSQDQKQDLRALVASKKDEALYKQRVDSYNKVIDVALSASQDAKTIADLNLLRDAVNQIGNSYTKTQEFKTNYEKTELHKANSALSKGKDYTESAGFIAGDYYSLFEKSVNSAQNDEEKRYIYAQSLNALINKGKTGKTFTDWELQAFEKIVAEAEQYGFSTEQYRTCIVAGYLGIYTGSEKDKYKFAQLLRPLKDSNNKEIKEFVSKVEETKSKIDKARADNPLLSAQDEADFMERAAGAHHLTEDDKDWQKFLIGKDKMTLLTNNEKDTLKYYIEKARKESGKTWDEDYKIKYTEANKYYELLKKSRLVTEAADDIVEWAQASNFRALIVSAFSGIESAFTGFANYFSNDDYIPYTALSYASSELRESLATDGFQMPEWLGGGSSAQMVFDLVGTSTRMVPSQIIGAVPGVGQVAGPVFMGMSSAGSAYQDAVNSGLSKKEAWLYSRLVGGSEAGLTYLFGGFSKLGGKVTNDVLKKALSGVSNGFARFALTTGGKVISEGFEEGAQSLLEPLFKNVATGFEADAYKDFEWSQVFYDALLGGLSAAPSASVDGVGAAANSSAAKINNAKIGIKLTNSGNVDTIINAALSLPADSEAYKLASKLGNKTPTSAQLGKLYVALSQYVEGKINDTAVSAITQRLTELGVSNPRQYASIIADLKSHKNVGTLKTKKVMNNPQAFQVFGELSSFGAQSKIFRDESSTNAQTKTVEWIEQLESDVEKLNVAQLIVLGLQNNAAGTNAVNIITSLLGGSENNQTANTETPTSDSERNLNAALSAVTGEKTPLQQGENGDIINSRGEENGSNNPELLEGRKVSTTGRGKNRVRTHGANTEIIRRELADVLQSKGNDVVALAAGESAWLSERNLQSASQVGGGLEENFLRSLQRVKSNGYDSIGRVLDADLQEKVSDTVFKYEDGTVFSFFHWTPNEFETFKYGDGAFHCGTLMSALAVKNRSEPSGILKEMYVISKNPFVLRDEGAFGPYSVALQLKEFGIINDKELAKISELKGFWSNRYETEACEYVRELLKSLGYDSYFYQNIHEDTGSWSVGVFDADQIITIAENGVLKPNCGVSEATSNNEAAFSMPENDAEGDYSAEGDTDPTQTSQAPQDGKETLFDEELPPGRIERQKRIVEVAKKLDGDLNVVWVNKSDLCGKNGLFIRETNTIYLAKDIKLPQMYVEVFKHEFVHRLESRAAYKSFKDYLINNSRIFEKYVRAVLKEKYGEEFRGSREEAIYELSEIYRKDFTEGENSEKVKEEIKENFNHEMAQREIVADFVGEVLFKDKKNRADIAQFLVDGDLMSVSEIESSIDFFEELAIDNRNLLQKAIDIIKDFISRIKYVSDNRTPREDLEYIEQRLMRVYQSRDSKKAANNAGKAQYSTEKSFEQQVDDVINGNHNPRYDIYVSQTPDIYVDLGFTESPLLMRNSKISTILNDHSEMTIEAIKKIPEAVQNPILVLKSKTHPKESVVAITDIQTDKGEVILPIWINQDGNYLDFETGEEYNGKTNFVASAYGRNIKNLLSYANENDGFLYQSNDIEKVRQLLARNGLQLPTPLKLSDSDIIVPSKEQSVNTNFMQKSENYTEGIDFGNGQFSSGSPMQRARERNSTHLGEDLKDTPDHLKPTSEREWSAFVRSFANQTNGLKDGREKSIIITTNVSAYKLSADGYMSGVIESKISIDEYLQKGLLYDSIRGTDFDNRIDEILGNRQRNGNGDSVFTDRSANTEYDDVDAFIDLHPEFFANKRENYADYKRKQIDNYNEGVEFYGSVSITKNIDYTNEEYGNRPGDNSISSDSFENRQRDSGIAGLDELDGNSPDIPRYTVKSKDARRKEIEESWKKLSNDIKNKKGQYSSGSPMQKARENLARYENGEISREEYLEGNDKLYGEAIEKYGAFEQGENAKAPISVPRKVADDASTEQFVRTVVETGRLTNDMVESIEAEILTGGFSYEVMSDEAATKKAIAAIENGTAADRWQEVVNGRSINKNDIAIGEQLLAEAIEAGDTKLVLEVSAELADVFTRAGQAVQSARLLKKMTGAGRIVAAQRFVRTLNKDLRQKYGDDMPPIKISVEAAQRLANAKTQEGIENAYQEIMQDLANQVPSTWLDKWNTWRYFAMLSNPKTHIRNIVGNAIFLPVVRTKNLIAYGLEAGANKFGIIDDSQRTKSLKAKREYIEFARSDVRRDDIQRFLKGNKYNDKSALREKQRVFENETLEFVTSTNSNLLELEDMIFKNEHYVHALAGYLQARKINLDNITDNELTGAREYAVKEAKKATFNDENKLADEIARFSGKNAFGYLAVEGILPFKRTPLNIVKRGIEYSPLGLAKTLTKGLRDVKKGKITVTEYIDGLASGLTGTGIMAAGMFLASLGCISGGMDDDDESQFEKWLGKQEYAVEIFGKSYTIDWAAPSCIPFFIGVELMDSIKNDEDFEISKLGNVFWNSMEPIINLSMLKGVQSTIETTKYSDSNQIVAAIAGDIITTYSTQALPAFFGGIARTIDSTERTWYTDKNSKFFDSFAQSASNSVRSKVPGLTYTQAPKISPWGQEVKRGNVGERLAENFLSPGYYSELNYTEMDNELLRLGKATGENVYPKVAAKSFTLNGETKHLTQDEYVTFAKAKGQYSHDYITEFMSNSCYDKLSDEQRTEIIAKLYEYATAKAKITVSDYDLTKRYKTVTRLESDGISAVMYYIYNTITSDNYADTNGDNKVSKLEKRTAREAVGFDVEIARKIK